MRRLLLAIANFLVGGYTLIDCFVLFSGQPGAVSAALISWLVILVIGIVLSAPFFLRPPQSGGGWALTLPIVLALMVMVIRCIAWVGYMVLLGVWTLAYMLWRPAAPAIAGMPAGANPFASASPGPGPGGPGPNGAAAPSRPPLPLPPAGTPASWRRDPSGRHQQRYWDGVAWTSMVGNGGATAIDPP